MKLRHALACTALFACTGTTFAVPTIFFGENLRPNLSVTGDPVDARNAFLAGLTGVGNEDFEGFSTGTAAPINLSFPGSSGAIGATLSGDGRIQGSASVGRFATSCTKYWDMSAQFDLTFTTAISAFGFYGTDIG